ncbi:MAG: FAD-dependent oxidoreductase [Candidatus Hydrogenedentota bacterium]
MKETYAVIGAGPLGSCAARALADAFEDENRSAEILLIDANDPLNQKFDSLSAAGPHAAGQLMLHFFDADSSAKDLTRRSHEILKGLNAEGAVDLHSRPWICCTGNTNSELDTTAQEGLAQSFSEGRLEGCELVRGEELPGTKGLRADQVAWALLDPTGMAVNPRVFVQQLAQRAIQHPMIEAHFHTRVTRCSHNTITTEYDGVTTEGPVTGVILCTGIHRDLFTDALPDGRPEFLHVTEHKEVSHRPEVMHLISGETTIARYAGFGPHREKITPLLPENTQKYGIHGLFTDVPGLRRMLDSHFENEDLAESKNDLVWSLLRETIGRYIQPEMLLGHSASNRETNLSYVAAYNKLLDSDGPYLEQLPVEMPTVHVQPSNGLGLNQCAALGADAASLLMEVTG